MEFKSMLQKKMNFIEDKMELFLPEETGYQKIIFEAMNYSLKAGGKRLRPILLMEAYRISGGKGEEYLPYSMGMEMIHTYSLIHDDLPALDNDDLRRGKPTNHKVFGEAMAILAGDSLLNHAFETMLEHGCKSQNPDVAIKAIYEISKASGVNGMIGGQVVDILSEKERIPKEKLDFIHLNKTAAMIVACMRAGAILAKASEKELEALTTYGEKIGLAFQIVDDILDIEGSEEELGKKVGSDIMNEKSTCPSLIGMDESKKISKRLIDEAKNAIEIFGEEKIFLNSLADYIISRSK